MNPKLFISSLLEPVDIRINGSRPWDIQVHNEDLYARVVKQGTLGAGESYMDGWWDCEALDVMFCKAIRGNLEERFKNNLPNYLLILVSTLFNMQSVGRASIVAEKHYNWGNDMFSAMLGPSMNYSCGYWKNADNLDQAQYDKMELICRKLQLQEGMTVLDIGCGWGALARYMSEKYKVKATGISVSSEQIAYAKEHDPGNTVNFLLEDYRSLTGHFDRIVSVGMFEHVGRKNYAVFMETTKRLLAPDGLFLLHTIGSPIQKAGCDAWIAKYIFPNGVLPSMITMAKAITGNYVMEDWHNFGADYDKTLMAWYANFEKGRAEGKFSCTERARRMFNYYLLMCAAVFRARDINLWQIVLSPQGVDGGYASIR